MAIKAMRMMNFILITMKLQGFSNFFCFLKNFDNLSRFSPTFLRIKQEVIQKILNSFKPYLSRKLLWEEDFSRYHGPEKLPNPEVFTHEVGVGNGGWGNNELQYYTDKVMKNARVESGKLIIEAHQEFCEGMNYTSARLVTKHKRNMKYGRVEVKAKLPRGRGTWPAIWLLGANENFQWPRDGEIDIMEHVGYEQGLVHGTVHCEAFNGMYGNQRSGCLRISDCADVFHVYAIDWTPERIEFFIDNNVYFCYENDKSGNYATWPYDKEMFLILNIAVGGTWGGQQGVDPDIWPQKMEIESIKYYEMNNPNKS